MPTIPPWPPTITPLTLKGGAGYRHDSAALCDDGRIIYVYVDGNNIYQCHYPQVGVFEHAANTSATTPVEFHSTLNSAMTKPLSTVWRHPTTGVLYLLVNYRTTVPSADGRVWVSPSGNGESSPGVPDWTAQGTVFGPVTTTFGADLGFNAFVGEPYVTGTGRWIVTSYAPSTWDTGQSAIYTSDNEGATWTVRSTGFGYGPGFRYGFGMGRNIVSHAGAFWVAANGNTGGPFGGYSTNNGTTWTVYTVDGGTNNGASNPVTAAGSAAWRIYTSVSSTSNPVLQVGTAYDGLAGTWGLAADVTAMDGYTTNGAVLQRLTSGHDVFLWDGHILAGRGGWGVGQIRIA